MAPYSLAEAARDALLIAAAVIATRLTWYRRPQQRLRRSVRGIGCLPPGPGPAAAFRWLIVLVTFGVILVILVTLLMTRGTALGPTA